MYYATHLIEQTVQKVKQGEYLCQVLETGTSCREALAPLILQKLE